MRFFAKIQESGGFGLAEIGPAIAIGLIISGALVEVFNMNFRVQQNVKTQVEVSNLHNELVNRLANAGSCQNTFGGVVYDQDRVILAIPGQPVFTTGNWYGNNLVQIQRMILLGTPPNPPRRHTGTTFYGDFEIDYLRRGQTIADVRTIRIHFLLDNNNNVQDCNALIGKYKHLWTPTFNTNNNLELHYFGGTIGIGPFFGSIQPVPTPPPPPNLVASPGGPRIDQVYQNITTSRNNVPIAAGFPPVTPTQYSLDVGTLPTTTSFQTAALNVGGNVFVSGRVVIANSLQIGTFLFPGAITANARWWSSDRRLKRDIRLLASPLDNLLQLQPISYEFKNQGKIPEQKIGVPTQKRRSIGLVAQDVEEVFPELVSLSSNGYKLMNYHGLIPLEIEAVKELAEDLDQVEGQITSLRLRQGVLSLLNLNDKHVEERPE